MISLITTIIEASIAIISFFSKRAQRKEDLKNIMDDFSKKHDSEVQKNIVLRKEYEDLKRKMEEEKNARKTSEPTK